MKKEHLICAIIFMGITVLFFYLAFQWKSLEWDEGVSYTSSKQILNGEIIRVADVIPSYLLSLSSLFIISDFRIGPIVNAIILLFSCLTLYLIIFNLTKKKSLALLGVLALASYSLILKLISWRPYQTTIFFWLISLLLLTKYLENRQKKYLFLMSFTVASLFYSKNLSLILIVPFSLVLFYDAIREKRFKNFLYSFLLPLILILLPFMIIRFVESDYNFWNTLAMTDFNNSWSLKYSDISAPHITNFFQQREGSSFTFFYKGIGVFPVVLLFIFLALDYNRSKNRKNRSIFLYINLLVGIFFFLFMYTGIPFHDRYLAFILPSVIIQLCLVLNKNYNKKIFFLAYGLLLLFFFFNLQLSLEKINSENNDYYQDLLEIQRKVGYSNKEIISPTPAAQIYFDNKVYNPFRDFSEEEATCYFTWNVPCLEKIFDEKDIGWIVLRNSEEWEVDAVSWLEEAKGLKINHYYELNDASQGQKEYRGQILSLYKPKLK